MSVRLSIESYGETLIERELLRFAEAAQDMRPAFQDVALEFRDLERKQFASQGKRTSAWAPLSPRYLAWKIARGYDRRILHRTLRLRGSLTQKGHPDHVERITQDELFVGSRVPYGAFHQYGTRRMPRRRPVDFTERDKVELVRTLQRHLVTGSNRSRRVTG